MDEKWIIAEETRNFFLPPIKHKRRCCSVERRIDGRKCIVNMSHQVVFLGICLIALVDYSNSQIDWGTRHAGVLNTYRDKEKLFDISCILGRQESGAISTSKLPADPRCPCNQPLVRACRSWKGSQLQALLSVLRQSNRSEEKPYLIHNESQRYLANS